MIYPSTATLASDGQGTAVLTQPAGFGEAFGEAFGGWVTTVDAVINGNGTGAATLADVSESADLVLV